MRSDQVSPIPLNLDDGNQNVASALRAEDELAVSGVVSGRGILALVFPAVTDRQMLQIEYWKINARTAAHYSARSICQPDGRWWRGVYFCFVSSWNRSAQLSTVLKAAISFH